LLFWSGNVNLGNSRLGGSSRRKTAGDGYGRQRHKKTQPGRHCDVDSPGTDNPNHEQRRYRVRDTASDTGGFEASFSTRFWRLVNAHMDWCVDLHHWRTLMITLVIIVCLFVVTSRTTPCFGEGGMQHVSCHPCIIYIVRVYADVDRRTRSAPDSIGADLVYCVFMLVLY